MSNQYEGLVPFFKLYQNIVTNDGNIEKRVIGDSTHPLDTSEFGSLAIMGNSDASIKFAGGGIVVKVSMPVHQAIIHNAAIENSDSGYLNQIFSLNAYWEIEYGWGGTNDISKISSMKLINWSIDYAADLRSFNIGLEFVPANNLVLADIKLHMLKKDVNELRQFMAYESLSNVDMGKVGHPLSLGNIITKLLRGCKNSLFSTSFKPSQSNGDPQFDENWKDKKSTSGYQKNDPALGSINDGGIYYPSNSGIQPSKKIEGSSNIAYLSEVFLAAKLSDIPSPEKIRLVVFGSDTNTAYDKAKAFNSEKLANEAPLDLLTNDKYKDVSVLQFVTSLLNENGFTVFPNVGRLGSDGKIEWMIIQTEFNNVNRNEEKEFEGIHVINKQEMISNGDKFVNTIVNDTSGTKLFDLHSNKNVVKSINASVDNGESTIGSIEAAQQLANGSISQDSEQPGEVMKAHRDEIFSYLAKQAKTIDIDSMGISSLKIYDNVYVNLGGILFSGLYKIIELEHKISNTFDTSFTAIQTRSGLPESVLKKDEQPIEPDTPQFTIQYSDGGEVGEFGSEKDVKANPRRYR